ncbi:MAG: Wadjet anti-phage system protein JetD domain-containing protein [Streptosporangiaceae bacterium]
MGRAATAVPVTSVLMDLAMYERYERFGTSTDARGNPLTATACRPLLHLTAAERQLYERLLDPSWTRSASSRRGSLLASRPKP